MTAASIRATLQGFFQDPPLLGMQGIYLDQPWFIDGGQFQLSTQGGWGAVGYLHLDMEEETRVTMPAITGSKAVDYTVGLVIQYQYLIPTSLAAGAREDDWVTHLDAIIDAVKDRIRSDPTLGGANTSLFEGGQSPQDIKVARDLPKKLAGKVLSFNVVEFNVTEIVQA